MSNERYTHGHHESVLRSHQWRTAANSAAFLLPHLSPNDSLLDIGCGPGTITADLAGLTTGSVIGVDQSADVVQRAANDFPASSYPNLTFREGDVYHLAIPDESFDVTYAHQVLQHVSNPVGALACLRRVLKIGGLLAVRDADFGGFIWSPADPILDDWLRVYHHITRRNGAEADAGRHLKEWVVAAGFTDLLVTSSTWTFESPEERTWWGGLWADRILHSDFATQALEYGVATRAELSEMSAGFHRWSNDPHSIFIVPHCEVLARSPG